MRKLIKSIFTLFFITFEIDASDSLVCVVPVNSFLSAYQSADGAGSSEGDVAGGSGDGAAVVERPRDHFLKMLAPHQMGTAVRTVERRYAREISADNTLRASFPGMYIQSSLVGETPSTYLLEGLFKDGRTPITLAPHPASHFSVAHAGSLARLVLRALNAELSPDSIEPELGRIFVLPGRRIPSRSALAGYYNERFVNGLMGQLDGMAFNLENEHSVISPLLKARYSDDPKVMDDAWSCLKTQVQGREIRNINESGFKEALSFWVRSKRLQTYQERFAHMRDIWQRGDYTQEEIEKVEGLVDTYRAFAPLNTHELRARGRGIFAWNARELLRRIVDGDQQEGISALQTLGAYAVRKSLTPKEMDPFYQALMGNSSFSLLHYQEFRMAEFVDSAKVLLKTPSRFHKMPESTRRVFTDFTTRAIGGDVPWVGYTTASATDITGKMRTFSNCWEAAFLNTLRTMLMRFETGVGWSVASDILPEGSAINEFFKTRRTLSQLATQNAINAFADMVGCVGGVFYAKDGVETATSIENTARLLCYMWGIDFEEVDESIPAEGDEEEAERFVRVLGSVGDEITKVSGACFGLGVSTEGELNVGVHGLTGNLIFEARDSDEAIALCKLTIEDQHATTQRLAVPGRERERDWRDAVVEDVLGLWQKQVRGGEGGASAAMAATVGAVTSEDEPELSLDFLSVVEPEAVMGLVDVLPASYFEDFFAAVDLSNPEVGIGVLPAIFRNMGNASLGRAPEVELLKIARLVERQDDEATTRSFSEVLIPAIEKGVIPRNVLLELTATARILPSATDPTVSKIPLFQALCQGDDEMMGALNTLMNVAEDGDFTAPDLQESVADEIRATLFRRLAQITNVREVTLASVWAPSVANIGRLIDSLGALPRLTGLNLCVEDDVISELPSVGRLLAAVDRPSFALGLRSRDFVSEQWNGKSKAAVCLAIQRCLSEARFECILPSVEIARLYFRSAVASECELYSDAEIQVTIEDANGSTATQNVAGQLLMERDDEVAAAGSREAYLAELRAIPEIIAVIEESRGIEAELRAGMAAALADTDADGMSVMALPSPHASSAGGEDEPKGDG